MIKWLQQLRISFGASFLWLVCLIYFTQGFRSFVWTAVSYQLKDELKLSPSASQLVSSVAFFPWSIKPLYGILSDCIPIKGRKRIPYLVISTILSFLPWLGLGHVSLLRNSREPFMICLTLQNLGSAMADVVVDAMIAEAVRSERAAFAGDLQSLSWMAMAFGGICGSLLGGHALTNFQIENIFLIFAVFPAIQLFSCCFVDEKVVVGKGFSESPDSEDSHWGNENVVKLDEDKCSMEKSKTGVTRRKKIQNKGDEKLDRLQNSEKGRSLGPQLFQSLKMASYTLLRAFRQPMIIRPMTWFFMANVVVPNLSTIMFYYHTEYLNLEASFLGTARVIGWLGLMLGTFIYNRYLKKMKLRTSLLWAQVGLSLLTVLDMILVSRKNIAFGLTDKGMVLWGSALADAINQFKFMPFLILSGQLCPPGIEGTLFALFMSINNFGNTLGSFFGAWLASILSISSGSFDNLIWGVGIQVICTFIPIVFLFLIPKEATGVSE